MTPDIMDLIRIALRKKGSMILIKGEGRALLVLGLPTVQRLLLLCSLQVG
jgi:hypothetical protein